MKITSNVKTILGLTKEEVSILEALSDITMRISDVHKVTGIPRTTVERILHNLHKRKLVHKHKYSARRGGYKGKTEEEIVSDLFLDEKTHPKEAYKVTHLVGFEAMRAFEYEFFGRYKNKTYYGIQGIRPWRAFHSSFGKEEAHTINSLLGKHNILADIIISKNTDKELLKRAYFDRPSLVHSIPDSFLSTAFDLEVTAKEVVIMNWEKKRALSIEDEEVAKFFLGIFEYIKESSEYYNVYKAIAEDQS